MCCIWMSTNATLLGDTHGTTRPGRAAPRSHWITGKETGAIAWSECTFWGATNAHENINGCTRLGHLDGSANITIRNESDASTSCSALLDDVRMPRPIQNDDCHITAPAHADVYDTPESRKKEPNISAARRLSCMGNQAFERSSALLGIPLSGGLCEPSSTPLNRASCTLFWSRDANT